jgi:hypothetical protein
MKSGSACVVVELRCERSRRGDRVGRDTPKSIRLIRICSAVVMIEAPPGEPIARKGLPSRSTIVGDLLDRGRLPGAGRFGSGALPVSARHGVTVGGSHHAAHGYGRFELLRGWLLLVLPVGDGLPFAEHARGDGEGGVDAGPDRGI